MSKEPSSKPARDPQRTRARILHAAEVLFANRGYAATRVQEIADRARINKRMLYHYFGNKLGLYEAVATLNFREILEGAARAGGRAFASEGPVAGLAALIAAYFDAINAHPRYMKFLAWESAAGWTVMNGIEHGALDELRTTFIEILRAGIRGGEFDASVEPESAWSYLVGVPAFYFIYRPRLQLYWEGDLSEPEMVASFRQEIIHFALKAVGARPDPYLLARVTRSDAAGAVALSRRRGGRGERPGRDQQAEPAAAR